MVLKFLELLESIMIKLGALVLCIMTVWVFSDAMGRYLFNHPLSGTLEVTEEILMILVVFFAMSYTQKVKGHVRVDIFEKYIPVAIRPVIGKINLIVMFGFSLLVVIQGFQQFKIALKLNSVSRGILAYPLAPTYLLMTIGMVVLCLRLIYEIFSRKRLKEGPDA